MIDAYIITLSNHEKYKNFSNKVLASCLNNQINAFIWEAFDGILNKDKIIIPTNLQTQTHISLLKVKNLSLTLPEIACFYSHYSLWCHCVHINKSIIILEHDVEIIKNYKKHEYNGCIVYLGHNDQLQNNEICPVVSIENHDYEFIKGTHAYSIDPSIAKNLVSYTIREGICRPLDVTIRSDFFPIIQNDIFAVSIGNETTMPNRVLFQETHNRITNTMSYK